METVYAKYSPQGVVFAGLTDEDQATIQAFAQANGMHYPLGCGSTSAGAYGVQFIPDCFVIDATGKITWEGSPGGLDAAIAAALGGGGGNPPPPPGTVATPTFSPAPGTYPGPQTVTIDCVTVGATVRYTTDGSNPNANSPAYAGPLNVSVTTTINAFAVSASMTDSGVATGLYTITSSPPSITSPLTVTGTVGTPFSYTFTASGQTPITFEAVGIPFGLSLNGATISGTPSATGSFSVSVRACNDVGCDTKTLVIIIGNDPNAGGGGGGTGGGGTVTYVSNTKTDSDSDGFADELEVALATSPSDANSTPMGGSPAGAAQMLTVSKMRIKLNFATVAGTEGKDSIALAGTLPVPAGFLVANQQVTVDIGGVIRTLKLDAKGASTPKGVDALKLRVKAKQGSVAAQDAKFSIKLTKGVFSNLLADEGLLGSADVTAVLLNVPVVILFSQQSCQVDQPQLYWAKRGKTGWTK